MGVGRLIQIGQQAETTPQVLTTSTRPRHVRVVDRGAVVITDRASGSSWHLDANRVAGEALVERLERATALRKDGLAARTLVELLDTIHADRVACAEDVAVRDRLRLERAGRGPVFDRPAVHRNRTGSWYVCPVTLRHWGLLPETTQRVVRSWQAVGDVFDVFYLGDELPSDPSGRRLRAADGPPGTCLIGAISREGTAADWFVLDRWSH